MMRSGRSMVSQIGACSSVKTGLCKMDRQNYFFSLGGVDNYNPY